MDDSDRPFPWRWYVAPFVLIAVLAAMDAAGWLGPLDPTS
jgi:hypothetical protein